MSEEDPDLTFVDPDRRAEVLRRIRVIEEFQRNPGRANAERAARSLGMNNPRFYMLAKMWRTNRRPEQLAGKQRTIRSAPRIDARVQDIIKAVETKHPAASAGVVERAMRPLLKDEGLAMPSRPTIVTFIQKIRLARDAAEPAGEGLAIDFCAVGVTIPFEENGTLPVAALVIDLRGRAVVGCAIAIEASTKLAVAALRDALGNVAKAESANGPKTPFTVARSGELAPLVEALRRAGIDVSWDRHRPGHITKKTFGPTLGSVRLFPKLASVEPRRRKIRGAPMTLEEADAVIRARVLGRRDDAMPRASLSEAARSAIAAALPHLEDD